MPCRGIVVLLVMLGLAASGGAFAQAGGLDRLDLLTRQRTSETAIVPIYSQIVLFALPGEFRMVASGVTRSGHFEYKAAPATDSPARWTQLISVSGDEAEAFSGRSYPRKIVDDHAAAVRRKCPESFGLLPLDRVFVGSYDTAAAVFGCGSGPGGQSESILQIVVKGGMDMYAIEWAVRGPASKGPLRLDEGEWTDRLRRLAPIRLCAGSESPPYPKCLKRR